MQVRKGKHSEVDGPFKSFIMGMGGFGLLMGAFVAFNQNVGGGILIALGSIVVLWLGSKIPNKNRIEY